ncbi:MAG: gliding motility protein GldN [Bacteroides sp.]|nr:gliding motility protein GldN [Roseburia sp.]MCM1347037.1 gliding motility protein GldN [Bacteroides sp.]MCM1420726.1 gliding motility protein GldN [Bacteroides sp.]
MKHILFILFGICLAGSAMAQPAKSRVRANNAATNRTGNNNAAQTVDRATLMFPTPVDVPEDVAWRRDIYRTLDLKKDENAALYYPVEPMGNEVNLFTLIFQLLNTGKLPAYDYKLDGVEDFSKENRMHFKDMLERYHILYEVEGRTIKVDNSDVPSAEVLSFNVKESSYYDQHTATYHTRVVALCPVLHRADDFSMDIRKYPMFWVKYDDLAPYLSKHSVMTSNLNNAATMSMDDFFATNQYKGNIYMTTNMQNRSLQQYCATDSALVKEQKRIEKEITDFEKNIWATPVDSVELARQDSIENAANAKKTRKRVSASSEKAATASSSRTARRSSVSKKEKTEKSSSSSSGSSAPRVSVRRQRH